MPEIHDGDSGWGSEAWQQRYAAVIAHELVHIAQFKRLGLPLMAVIYTGPSPWLLLAAGLAAPFGFLWSSAAVIACVVFGLALLLMPLSLGLAYGRWWAERQGYLINLRQGDRLDWVVDTLWRSYLFPWPKEWMKRWFLNALKT